MKVQEPYSPAKRQAYKVCLFVALLMLLTAAASIPFIWESKTLWYKTGVDRTLLQVGKVFGICASILLFLQLLLALKLRFLDRIFGLDRLYYFHRLSGLAIVALAVVHASLILVPEGLENIPIGWKFWPEMLGGAILLLLIAFVGTALYRRKLMPYHLWRNVHRPLGYVLVIALSVHIFKVSDSFEDGIPSMALWILIGAVFCLVTFATLRSFNHSRRRLAINTCVYENEDVLSLDIAAPPSFSHAPGQFAILRLYGDGIACEAHPFTISSATHTVTGKDGSLQFYIKKCGDWTGDLAPKKLEQASIEGPFGLFSYAAQPPADQLVFIAGGIGITPLLSMLRQISRKVKQPEVMLLWSLSWKKDMFLFRELKLIQEKIPNLRVHIYYTREQGGRRLDYEPLRELLDPGLINTQFYICGPEVMIEQTKDNIKNLGFASKNIFWERFAF